MQITQLEKTLDNVLANLTSEDVYFIKHITFGRKGGGENHRFDIKRLSRQKVNDIEYYINDPDIALVKIEVK